MDLLEVVKYDFIVLGTGLEESLLASAAAKAGKTVLHLDPAAHYGTHWAGLQLDEFLDWAHACQGAAETPGAQTGYPEQLSVGPEITQQGWLEVAVCSNVGAGPSGLYHDVWIWSDPSTDLGSSRSYSIDLAPKVAFCAGPLIETLLQSGAHNYVEFKLLQGSYIWQGGRLQPVPASKGDVFRSRSLSPGDKRLLMRFLKACSDAMEGQGHLVDAFRRQPFLQLLQSEGLSENLQNIVLYAIAMCDSDQHAAVAEIAEKNALLGSTQTGTDHAQSVSDEAIGHGQQQQQHVSSRNSAQSARVQDAIAMTAEEGWRALQLYMASTGKYAAGGSAFMALVYGVGELSQAFCRVAAVAGATYVLRLPVSTILLDPTTRCCVGVRTGAGQILSCDALAADAVSLAGLDHIAASIENSTSITSADEPCRAPVKRSIARAVCIIDGSLQDGESQVLVVIPPGAMAGISNPVRVLQVGSATCSTPEGRYLLYLSTPATTGASAAQSLSAVVDALVQIPPDERAPAGMLPSDGVNQSTSLVEGTDSGASPCTDNSSAELHGHQLRSSAGANPGREESLGGNPSLMDIRPKALMVVYYLQDYKTIPGADLPQNIARCSPPDISLGFATILEDASSSFQRLYPLLNPSFLSTSEGKREGEESDEDTVEQLHSALASAILGG